MVQLYTVIRVISRVSAQRPGGAIACLALLLLFSSSTHVFADGDPAAAPTIKKSPQAVGQPVIADSVEPVESKALRDYGEIRILSTDQESALDKTSIQGEDIPFVDDSKEEGLDALQEKGSALVVGAAEWIDSFFNDPRYVAEENRTRAKVKLGGGYSKHYDIETYASIDFKVNLPKLENRANVFLRLNDDSDFDVDSSPISNTEGGSKNDREQLTAGVQYFLKMGERYNISVDTGLSLNYVYGGLRFRHLHNLSSNGWTGRFTDRIRWYSDDGWENKASYDIEKFFGERFLSRTIFTVLLSEETEGVPFSAVTRLFQVIDIDSALSYDVSAFFDTEPELELTDFQLKLRYRQRFYRDWLVLELNPLVTFPAEFDHEYNPGFIAKFEIDFGYLSNRKAYDSIFEF